MAVPIFESGTIAATTTDVLSGGRLNTMPFGGILTLNLIATTADATNNYVFTVQLPDGDVPVDAQLVPGANPALLGVFDSRQTWTAQYRVAQGGHVVLAVTESGTATMAWQAMLK